MLTEELDPDLVGRLELTHVGQEDGGLHHVGAARTLGLEECGAVGERLTELRWRPSLDEGG